MPTKRTSSTVRLALGMLGLAASVVLSSEQVPDAVPFAALDNAPSVTLFNGQISARIYLPDADRGFYRGTRFDWAGVFGGLSYSGHDFFVPWFHAVSAGVRDYVLDNAAVIAAPNTAAIGPVDEFNAEGGALGYADAAPGATFLKIGVGVLRRIDATAYDRFFQYPLVDSGRRSNVISAERADFLHQVDDPASGYGYEYTKTIRLQADQAVMFIEHELRNTGSKQIDTTVYNHNFLNIDGKGTTAGLEVSAAYTFQIEQLPDPALAEVVGNRIVYLGTPNSEQRVGAQLTGFDGTADDNEFQIINRVLGAGVRIQGDRPLTRAVLWSIQPVMSIEPFNAMSIPPGQTFSWSYRYQFTTQLE